MSWTVERIALTISIAAFVVFGISTAIYFDQQSDNPPTELSKQEISAVIVQNQNDLINGPGDLILGNPDGDVTLVEFFDYRCTYCKAIHPTVLQMLKDDGNIRYVAKEFPVLGPVSTFASQAALASQKQGKYPAFSAALMQARNLNKDTVIRIAQGVGLDPVRLKTDMKTFKAEIDQTLDTNFALAKALALKGTPAFIAGPHLIAGAPNQAGLEKLVARARSQP